MMIVIVVIVIVVLFGGIIGPIDPAGNLINNQL